MQPLDGRATLICWVRASLQSQDKEEATLWSTAEAGNWKLVAGAWVCKRSASVASGLQHEVCCLKGQGKRAEDIHLERVTGRRSPVHRGAARSPGTARSRVHGWGRAPPNVHTPTLQTHPEHLERAGVPLPPGMFLYCPLLRKRNTMLAAQEFHP